MICAHAYVWRIDKRPAPDFQRSEVIGEARDAAPKTGEKTLRFTVAFIDEAAGGACPARIARINQRNRNPVSLGFVFDKTSELTERPAMQGCSLIAASSCPNTKALQILKGNSTLGVFGSFDNLLADYMVYVGSKTLLLSRQLLKFTSCAIGSPFLQRLAKAAMAMSNRLDRLALVDRRVAINGDVRDAKIDAEKVIRIDLRRFFNIAKLMQVKLAFAVHEIAFAAQPGQKRKLLLSANKRHFLSSVESPDAEHALLDFVRNQPVVKRERCEGLKNVQRLTIQFVAIGDLGEDAHRNIRADLKPFADRKVSQFVQRKLAEDFFVPCNAAHVIAGGVSRFKRCLQRGMLFAGWLQFKLGNQFHGSNFTKYGELSQEWQFT